MDSDRFSSVLVKSNSENKTYILVKLSESFSSAIQEYSSSQSADINNLNPICTSNNISPYLQPNSNNHHNSLHHNHHNQHTNNHHNNHNNHLHHLNDTNSHNHTNHHNNVTTNNNHKKAKLHHNAYPQQKRAPTIKFHGTRGTIRFPSGKSYDFSLEQSDNSVECIKQVKNRWNSVGKMACCLHVKGKDDVYQRTRRKMEAAEQEKRKYCAKLLDSGNSETIPTAATTTTTTSTIAPAAIATTLLTTTTPASSGASTTTTTSTLASNSSSSCSSNSTTTKNNNISSNNLSKYPDITDVKQLKKYKADFDKDYKEYQSLHVYLQGIEERFRKLRELLKKSSEGSPEWEMAKEQIFSEYNLVKGDSNFHRARNKYKQLYQKLAYIKDKIFQFKSKQREKLHKNNTKGSTSGNLNNLHSSSNNNNNNNNNNNHNHNINNNKFY